MAVKKAMVHRRQFLKICSLKFCDIWQNLYLLLAELLVRTVNYRPSFFPSIYGPSVKRAGHKSMEKNEDP